MTSTEIYSSGLYNTFTKPVDSTKLDATKPDATKLDATQPPY